MHEGGVPLRDYVDALLRAMDARMVGARTELERRLEESAHDRERIRATAGKLVPRDEYDRTLGQAIDRLSRLEDRVSRIYGGLAVVVVVAGSLAIILRYLVG
jgi:hypothetical protein